MRMRVFLWSCLLLLFLTPALAGPQVANINVTAHEYYDEYERRWNRVEFVCVQDVNEPTLCDEEHCGGVEMAEVSLRGLPVGSEYQITVRWDNGESMEETYIIYQPGNINHWVDYPL